jgi:hypothetical protein
MRLLTHDADQHVLERAIDRLGGKAAPLTAAEQ